MLKNIEMETSCMILIQINCVEYVTNEKNWRTDEINVWHLLVCCQPVIFHIIATAQNGHIGEEALHLIIAILWMIHNVTSFSWLKFQLKIGSLFALLNFNRNEKKNKTKLFTVRKVLVVLVVVQSMRAERTTHPAGIASNNFIYTNWRLEPLYKSAEIHYE